ncbi:hypothetical protein ABPG74_012259 [Tetrahymena malaccensis]
MNTQFDLADQNPFLYHQGNNNNNGFNYFNASPFGKLSYNNCRSPLYFQNNPLTSNRCKKSNGSNNGNLLHQNLLSNQYPYHNNNNGSNISQFLQKENKLEESNKPITDFDTFYGDQERYMNDNNYCYQSAPTPFKQKSICEFNNDFQYQNKNAILNNNNNNISNNNNNVPYNNINFMQNVNNNTNKSQNLFNDKINYNNISSKEINLIPAQQSQKVTRGRGRPKKNPQAPPVILKKQKNSGCIAKKKKQDVSSSSDIDDEIEKEYLKEIQQASDQKNSEKYKNSIDSMKAEEESLGFSEQSKQQNQHNQQYQITTRKSSKSRQTEKQNPQSNNNEQNERACSKEFSSKQRPDTNERILQGYEQKQLLLNGSSSSREISQSKLQNVSNLLIMGGRQFGSPGSIKQIREKFIQQRNKQMFSNLAEDNLNFFPKIITENLLQKKQHKISQNSQKISQKQNKNIILLQENISSSEVTQQNQPGQNKHKQGLEKQSSENSKNQDYQNTNSQNQQDRNQKKQLESEKQQELKQQQDKQDILSEIDYEAEFQEKVNNSNTVITQNEISDAVGRKESPKQQQSNSKQNFTNQNDEYANRSTTLNSIIQGSSLKNLNKKYLHSTKLSKKINSSKAISKLQNQKKIHKKKLISKNQNKYQQFINLQQQNPVNSSFDVNLSYINNQIKMLYNNSIINQPQAFQELGSEQDQLNQIVFFEKQSFIYQNLSKQLAYIANSLKQKYVNSLLRKRSSQKPIARDERGLPSRTINQNNNYPNNFHHILPQHLINGSFVRQG